MLNLLALPLFIIQILALFIISLSIINIPFLLSITAAKLGTLKVGIVGTLKGIFIPIAFSFLIIKLIQPITLFNKPITQDGFYKGTIGELLRECKKIWNAKIVIKNQTEIWLVRDDEITNNAQFTLPPLIKYENPFYGLNTNEFKSNRVIAFQTDSVDKNTIQEYQGTIFQVTTEPIRVGNNPLMKGLEEVNINFALAKRKETLTVPEEILKDLLKTFDKLVGILSPMLQSAKSTVDVSNAFLKAMDVK